MPRPRPSQKSQKKRTTTQNQAKTLRSARRKTGGRKRKKKTQKNLLRDVLLFSLECLGLAAICIVTVIVILGYFGNRFSGTDFLNSLLPFAAGTLLLIILLSLLFGVWKKTRKWLLRRSYQLPLFVVLLLCLLISGFVPQHHVTQAFGYYRTLVGGKKEAGRVVLAHQVYAAYRRLDNASLAKMINRAEQFSKPIEEAATTYAIDADLLKGLAATESSYLPRKSSDGGHGLFQITRVPSAVTKDVDKLFPPDKRKMNDPRYNAFLGAATLRHYLADMNNDLFLGLLAYNIGPANGGLRFIMEQYGVTDFTTIQPYLLQLPRDYPIRVLAHALAFRIDRQEGRLLAYEEGRNALAIQAFGIPGQ